MINFILCDDEVKYLDLMYDAVTKYMMKNDFEYKVHRFNDYDSHFMKMIGTKLPFKVYILDIETPTRSGIDIARIIRNKDVDSVIIFLTGHQELSNVVIEQEFLFLAFINKFDNCKRRLMRSIDKALKVLKVKRNIKFSDNGITYTIALDDILYITKDSVSRKSIIKTDFGEFPIGKTLNEMAKIIEDDNFIQTHRACIVNRQRVIGYSKTKRTIVFDNGETTDLVSSRFEGKLV